MNSRQLVRRPPRGISANFPSSSPFKGDARRGRGYEVAEFTPIPTPTLPLKGREMCAVALKLAHMPPRGLTTSLGQPGGRSA
jgi:hypothetical protein